MIRKTKEIISSKGFLLGILSLILVGTSSFAYLEWSQLEKSENVQYALVDGNVDQPGYYKVNELTTNFEVLKKAGLNDSSNVNHIKLIQNVDPEKTLEVDVSEEKVQKKSFIDFSEPKLVYFIGSVSLARQLKISKPRLEQIFLERDKFSTQAEGKARIAFRNLAEIDINLNTKLKFQEINTEVQPTVTKIFLESGQLWIKIPKSNPGAKLIITTANAEVDLGEEEVEIIVSAKLNESTVHVSNGEVKVLDIDKNKKTKLKKDQIIVVNSEVDEVAPMQQKFTQKNVVEAFGDLESSFIDYKESQTEVSLLITSGMFNMVVSLIPKKDKIIFMDIPQNTYVGDYVDGVFRIDQALLIAGSELTREIVERIIARPLPFVMTVDLKDITKFAYTVQDLTVEVDPHAAVVMGVPPGLRRLERNQIIQFLNPDLPGGIQAATKRQKKVFYAFLRLVKEGGMSVYVSILSDLISQSNTNLPVKDAVKIFQVYNEKDNWRVLNIQMPNNTITKGNLVMVQPDYQKIRQFYTN